MGKMSAQFKTEVTRGTFDPRTYKTVDKDNWARKRKPEWMSTTGQIHFVRERQVPVVTPTKEEIMPESRAVTPTKEVKAPVPAVNVQAVHTTVPVAVPTATVHKTVQTHLVPQTRLVGHQVSHSVHHVPRVHVDTKTSTHTTHHVINHPPVIGAFAGAALPAGLVAGGIRATAGGGDAPKSSCCNK